MSYARAVLLLVTLGLAACGGGGGGSGGGGGGSGTSNFVTFQSASAIIGQSFATGNTPNNGAGVGFPNSSGMQGPGGHVASGSLYVADTGNNRVLGYATIPTGLGAPATFALGVPDFTTVGGGGRSATSATLMLAPASCCVADGKLFVADSDFERVLIWNSLPVAPVAADVALGKADLVTDGPILTQLGLSTVTDVCVAGGRVIAADFGHNRVMIWNSVPTSSGAGADLVIGQPDFFNASGFTTNAKLSQPTGVWSDGTRLVVCDSGNNRVLIWNTFPTVNGQPADLAIGQPNFTTNTPGIGSSRMSNPTAATSDGTQLFVADSGNNRVLIFNPFPTLFGEPAARVLGQLLFTNVTANDDNQNGISDAAPSARTLKSPTGVTSIGNQLFVSDSGNHRVLIFTGS